MTALELTPLERPHLADTGVWLWIRDRRFPELRRWFSTEFEHGHVLVAAPIVLELVRGAPNPAAAQQTAERLDAVGSVAITEATWRVASSVQLALARSGDHRRVPIVDLLLGAAGIESGVPVLHYDADFERMAAVAELEHRWLAPRGALA